MRAKHKLRRDGAQVKADERRCAGLTQIEMNTKKEFETKSGPASQDLPNRTAQAVFNGAGSWTAFITFVDFSVRKRS